MPRRAPSDARRDWARPEWAPTAGEPLLRHVVNRLFGEEGRRWFPGPLCLVAPAGRAALLDDLASRGLACGWNVIADDGHALGHEITRSLADDRWARLRDRFAAARLVVIQNLGGVGGADRQADLRQLFDASPTATWCIAVAEHPSAGGLVPDLAARIATGFVFVAPPADHEGRPAVGESADDERPAPRTGPSISRIVSATARHFGLRPAAILGSGRNRSLARARGLAMYLSRLVTGASFAAIGRAMGGRDHTTVMHGARTTVARLAGEPGFAADAEAILERLAGGPSRRRQPAGTVSIS